MWISKVSFFTVSVHSIHTFFVLLIVNRCPEYFKRFIWIKNLFISPRKTNRKNENFHHFNNFSYFFTDYQKYIKLLICILLMGVWNMKLLYNFWIKRIFSVLEQTIVFLQVCLYGVERDLWTPLEFIKSCLIFKIDFVLQMVGGKVCGNSKEEVWSWFSAFIK